MFSQEKLRNLPPQKERFIGIDSDGCVFNTMAVKQRGYFIPKAIEFFNLSGMEELLTETWEFINLYSRFRGTNRFKALVMTFDLLSGRTEYQKQEVRLPDYSSLKAWTDVETQLGNATLEIFLERNI